MSEKANPGPEARTQALSDEALAGLDKDPASVSNLAKADKYALVNHLMGGEDSPAPSPAESPSEAPTPAEEPSQEEAPAAPVEEAKSKDTPRDRKYWKDKAVQEAAERNRLKQQLEASQRRLKAFEEAESVAKAVKAEKPLDPYDDKEMKSAADRLAQLEKELASYREHFKSQAKQDAEELEKNLAQQEQVSVFTEIERLQDEFEDLRTEKSFDKCNTEYAVWLDRLVELSGFKAKFPDRPLPELRSMAREMYTDDEDFQKEALAKRAKPPKELEKIEAILTIHEKKLRDGGGYRANYLDHLAESGTLPNVIARREREAALKASRDTVDAMARGNRSQEQLNPSDGTNKFAEATGPEKMEKFIKDLNERVRRGHRMTAEEKSMAQQYMELLASAT